MKRIYYRLNWKEYLKSSGNKSKEGNDELYSLLYKEVKSASSKRQKELCIAVDNYTRTMILVPNEEYSELLEECMLYFQQKEMYEKCIEIRNTLQKVKLKNFKKRKNTDESHKLILIRMNPVIDD